MASNSSKQWTPEEDKRLLELEAAGKSRVLIAAALRRTVKSIPSRLSLLKLRQTKAAAPVDACLDGKSSHERSAAIDFDNPRGGAGSLPNILSQTAAIPINAVPVDCGA
jgi:hypothetical protein